MIPLFIPSHFGEHYQVFAQGQMSFSSVEVVTTSDAARLFSIITRELTIPAEQWRGVLMHLNVSIPPNFSHAVDIYHELVKLFQRRQLQLVKIPRLEQLPTIKAEEGWGYCFTQGPHRHPSLSYAPVVMNSLQDAQTLLSNIKINEKALSQSLPSSSGGSIEKLAELLANHSVIAYKIPVPTAAPPVKPVEFLPATAADKPVPLAPEISDRKIATTSATAKEDVPPVNPELEAREKELREIGKKLRTEGYVPSTDEEISNAVASGDLGNPRYLVSIQKSKSADEPIGYRRPDTGRTTMWTTTYDMLKKGDLSAPLLMSLLGSTYEPAAEYTMYILDQGENFEQDGALTFSPTWENMQKYCPEELHMDDPEDPIHDKALLSSVMNPDTQVKYQQTMESFWAETEGTGQSEYNEEHIDVYLANKGFSDDESDQFKARHLYRTQIGANAYFLGTGATEFTQHDKNKAAIKDDGISINGEPGKLGVPEMLTIEKNPPSIAALEKQGSLKSIPLKKGSV